MASKGKRTAQQRSSSLKGFYWLLGGVGVLGLAVIAMISLRGSKAVSEPIELPPEALSDVNKLVQQARGIKAGPDNAPIRILVFSDYMCPACRHFTTNVEPALRRDFINTGKVQLVYYDFPLGGNHQWSFLASRAGRCAEDQNKFWEYHDKLFATQQQWSFSSSAPVGFFEERAAELGLDEGAFKTCLNSDKHADLVTANKALGDQLGVGGTPTLFMNGRQLAEEWNDYGKLKRRLDQELGGTATTSPTTTQ